MYFAKAPLLLKLLYPKSIWNLSRAEKTVYLTFDDGPIPELTPYVLDILDSFQVKATFFCVGENIKKNPHLLELILNRGHRVGNHTYNHLNGRKTDTKTYLENVEACQELTQSDLFRPPYGMVRRKQLKSLYKTYRVIMWDILSGDYRLDLSPEDCLSNVLNNVRNGSIIIFHENIKASPRLEYALPRAIESLLAAGYTFKLL